MDSILLLENEYLQFGGDIIELLGDNFNDIMIESFVKNYSPIKNKK